MPFKATSSRTAELPESEVANLLAFNAKSGKLVSTDHYTLNVSIINYRTAMLTQRCLQSLLTCIDMPLTHITVVDNASRDNSVLELTEYLQQAGSDIAWKIIESPVNGGFSHGHNLGMSAVSADYHLVLNSDTLVEQSAITRLFAAAEREPSAGLIVPRLCGEDGATQQSCFSNPSPLFELDRAAVTGLITLLIRGTSQSLTPMSSQLVDADWVSFACVLIRNEVLQDVGLMDESYFLYFEDADYCRDIRAAGWQIYYQAEAKVVHLRGGTAPVKTLSKAKKRLPVYWYESRARFFRKTYGMRGLILANLFWYAGRLVAWTRFLLVKPVPPAHDCEWRDIWRGLVRHSDMKNRVFK